MVSQLNETEILIMGGQNQLARGFSSAVSIIKITDGNESLAMADVNQVIPENQPNKFSAQCQINIFDKQVKTTKAKYNAVDKSDVTEVIMNKVIAIVKNAKFDIKCV